MTNKHPFERMQTSVNGEKEPHGCNGHMYTIQCPEAYITA